MASNSNNWRIPQLGSFVTIKANLPPAQVVKSESLGEQPPSIEHNEVLSEPPIQQSAGWKPTAWWKEPPARGTPVVARSATPKASVKDNDDEEEQVLVEGQIWYKNVRTGALWKNSKADRQKNSDKARQWRREKAAQSSAQAVRQFQDTQERRIKELQAQVESLQAEKAQLQTEYVAFKKETAQRFKSYRQNKEQQELQVYKTREAVVRNLKDELHKQCEAQLKIIFQ